MPGNGLAAISDTRIIDDVPRVADDVREHAAADLRPILPRSSDNAWQKCETVRSELSNLIESLCRKRNMQALILQSNPFAHPIWVKFESWVPLEGSTLTARASMTVTITPMAYRRYESVYSVAWEKHGQSGTVVQLYRFGPDEVERMLDLLAATPEGQLTALKVRRILKPGQLRLTPLQLWRPRNKVVAVRRDWLKIGAWLLALAGFGLLVAADPSTDSLLPQEASAPVPGLPGMGAEPAPPPAAPAPPPAAAAAPPSRVDGTLDAADNRLPDGRLYDEYTYRKQPGEAVRITMHSSAFDAFLIAGRQAAGGFSTLASNDDESTKSLDAAIMLPAHLSGEIVIRATSAAAGERGAYTLEVSGQ